MKLSIINLFFVLNATLFSCHNDQGLRRDLLFECSFFCEENEIIYYLDVKRINYDEFIVANDKNVVEDDVTTNKNEKYYSINMYSSNKNSDIFTYYNFYNLHPVSKTTHEPISYVDDFAHYVIPCSVLKRSDKIPYYQVYYKSLDLIFADSI